MSEIEEWNKMIVTVTLNPAIDKTVEIEKFVCGGLNRIRKVEYDAGGKGINVSKTIHMLGGESIATGFLGGNNGRAIESVLTDYGIHSDFVWVAGETRTNTKVIEADGTLTELNEPGMAIQETDIQKLKDKLANYANEKTAFVFSGSVPQGVPKEIYKELILFVKEKGAYVLLDTDGEALCYAIEAKPNVIKPNIHELSAYLKSEDIVQGGRNLQRQGIANVVISKGKEGAIFLMEDCEIICDGLAVEAQSTVGAGDAMVAALAYAWEHHLHTEETVKLCMATSAGAVTTIGTKPPSRKLVDSLMEQVDVICYSRV